MSAPQMPMATDLPENLEIPLSTGRDWWYWTAGRPALDLVNTLRERWRRRVECLCSPEDLAEWLRRAGLLEGPADADAGLLGRARDLREAIDVAVVAVTGGARVPEAAITEIDAWLPLRGGPALALRDGIPHLGTTPGPDPVTAALAEVALDAARMLGTGERSRIRVCGAPDCSARFFDRSPAGRRRWCSMARCGNRSKVRAHRARHRTTT